MGLILFKWMQHNNMLPTSTFLIITLLSATLVSVYVQGCVTGCVDAISHGIIWLYIIHAVCRKSDSNDCMIFVPCVCVYRSSVYRSGCDTEFII